MAATGDMPASAVAKAEADVTKAATTRDEAVARADVARETLAALENRHGVALADARASAAEHYRREVTSARQRLVDALLAAADANDQLRGVLDRADLLGVRGLPGGRG